ncbi:MAG: hypothetical protein ACI8WB_004014 [Phenylobacterium sp.]
MPLQQLQQLGNKTAAELLINNFAITIYQMEGECLKGIKHRIKRQSYKQPHYPAEYSQLGLIYPELLTVVQPNLSSFEALIIQNKATITAIDHAISRLHATTHIQKVELSYIRARLAPLPQEQINQLVSVNPFTRGLIELMTAFAAEHEQKQSQTNTDTIINHYQEALPALFHIKFYYMQGHYYYARFLQQQQHPDFTTIYQQGLPLTVKHHYRYWQHQFKLLDNPQLGDFNSKDYPLPGNPDPTAIVNAQIKYIKQVRKEAGKKGGR